MPRPTDSASAHAASTLDDLSAQAGFTSWATASGGERIGNSHLRLSGLYCAACAGLIEGALRGEPGARAWS